MIAKMVKYNFVLLAAQSDDFVDKLREIGLVDITTTGWEPSEKDRQLILDIEASNKVVEFLRNWCKDEAHASLKGEPYASGREAFTAYVAASQEAASHRAEIARLEKMADELRPWGAFDVAQAEALAAQGIVLRYFSAPSSTFDNELAEWSKQYTLAEISRNSSMVWFVAVAKPADEIVIDAQEIKAPQMDIREVEQRIADEKQQLASLDAEFARAAASLDLLVGYVATLKEQLQNVKVRTTAEEAADGMLVVMEGWAEKDSSGQVDTLLEQYPNVVYLKADPTPEDNTPVKLKNGWYARIFEMVGDMYARPKYGTIDLTPFFAPFYMLFFGICLNDAGYGLILLAIGAAMLWKFREKGMMRRAAWFATMCAIATILFGGYGGSFFGLSLGTYFPQIPFFDFQGKFFSIALAIGVVQIMFGLMINVWGQTRAFGFTSSFGTLGWLIVLLAGSIAIGLPMFGMEISWFTTSSPAFYAAVGVGAVLMLLLNNIRRNPLVNFGSGLWDLYNNITGLLSDVLSYIRLFAIGLSGGVLALVFNSLAEGFVPEGANIVVRILVMLPILLIGHGINLFMSTISSFVHPMRLTFVEFYKNAGFEMAARNFEPLKKENQINK